MRPSSQELVAGLQLNYVSEILLLDNKCTGLDEALFRHCDGVVAISGHEWADVELGLLWEHVLELRHIAVVDFRILENVVHLLCFVGFCAVSDKFAEDFGLLSLIRCF